MKFILLIFFFSMVLLACTNTKKVIVSESEDVQKNKIDTSGKLSSFNNDTLKYLTALFSNKQKYIGKPLSVFLTDLETPVISFFGGSTLKKAYNAQISLLTNDFTTHYSNIGNKVNAYEIFVYWKDLQPMDSVKAIKEDNGKNGRGGSAWSQKAKDYFSKIVVGNIAFSTNQRK